MNYALVLVPGLEQPLSYSCTPDLQEGTRVVVPLRGRMRTGWLWQQNVAPPPGIQIQPVARALDAFPMLGTDLMRAVNWTADYYGIHIAALLYRLYPAEMTPDIEDGYVCQAPESLPDALRNRLQVRDGVMWLSAESLKRAALKPEALPESCQRFPVPTGAWRLHPDDTFTATPNLQEQKPKGKNQQQAFAVLQHKEIVTLADFVDIYANPATFVRKALREGWIRSCLPVAADDNPVVPVQVSLTEEQSRTVSDFLDSEPGSVHYLFGETGSGKTEVFYSLLQEARRQDRQTLLLEPEIGIATQVFRKLRARLDGVALYHSAMPARERMRVIEQIRLGEVHTVVGARSAIFLPFQHLDLVLVDEEHESGYKAPDAPYLHGRNLALVLARQHNARTLLASATPSLESWQQIRQQRYTLHRLTRRFGTAQTHYRWTRTGNTEDKPLRPELHDAINLALTRGEQVAILKNRRGRFRHIQCGHCGMKQCCPYCPDIPLVEHRKGSKNTVLRCHICGYTEEPRTQCEYCRSQALARSRPGTQRWEEWLQKNFPDAEIIRIDSDATAGVSKWLELYDRLASGRNQILIGTQMLAKGFDLPNLTTMICTNVDSALEFPEPRAWERTFALMRQAAGRVGRRKDDGTVWIDSTLREHPVLLQAIQGHTEAFLDEELARRTRSGFPPARRAALLYFAAPKEPPANAISQHLKNLQKDQYGTRVNVLGPLPETTLQMASSFRAQALVLSDSIRDLHTYCEQVRQWVTNNPAAFGVQKIRIDYDPVDFGIRG